MAALYPKTDLIEVTLAFLKQHPDEETVSREDLDIFIDRIDENGRVIYSSKADKNIVLESFLAEIAVNVLANLIAGAILAGAAKLHEHYKGKDPKQLRKELGTPEEGEEGEVVLQVIVFVQKGDYPSDLPPDSRQTGEKT